LPNKKVLLLSLRTFSLTGGIEKVCRALSKALSNGLANQQISQFHFISMYDNVAVTDYISEANFKGYAGNKIAFALAAVKAIIQHDVIILSHVHLLLFISIFKKINSKKRIILLAHGIEVWQPLSNWKLRLLKQVEIWAVSNYTANKLKDQHHIPSKNIRVVHNGLDPFFKTDFLAKQQNKLLEQYHLAANQPILLTICRLSSLEQYKGYHLVLLALKDLVMLYPNLVYFILGKADELEKAKVTQLVADYKLINNVYLTGYVSDEELKQYYQLADIFVMPSKGEGFGLVFIEAAANGCAVIAGNKDGSADALCNGDLGTLIDPDDVSAIYEAILHQLKHPLTQPQINWQKEKVMHYFGFPNYQAAVFKQLAS